MREQIREKASLHASLNFFSTDLQTRASTNSFTSTPTTPLTTHPAHDPTIPIPPTTDLTSPDHVRITAADETNTPTTQRFSTYGHPAVDEGTTDEKVITPLVAGVTVGIILVLTAIVLALGIFIKISKKSAANRNIEMKENDAHVADKDIVTAANDCYAHSAELKENTAYALPSKIKSYAHSAEMKENTAYALTSNIDTSINESYATNTNMAANPAYGTHDSTYAAIAEPEDKYTTSQPEYDYVINRLHDISQ